MGQEVEMSPGRKDMFRERRWFSSFSFVASELLIVDGRRKTVMLVCGGARVAREVRIAVPSSPAPSTKILVVAMIDQANSDGN